LPAPQESLSGSGLAIGPLLGLFLREEVKQCIVVPFVRRFILAPTPPQKKTAS